MMFLRLGDRFKKAGLAWLAVACLGVLGGATSLAGASAGGPDAEKISITLSLPLNTMFW